MADSAFSVRHVRAFVFVARFQSFSRAAVALHVSQPALTMAIRQLEDIVGTSLLERTTRRVALTPEGADFLPTAQRLLSDFDLAVQDIRAAATRRRGRIGIASVHSVSTKILPLALNDFAHRHPSIKIQIREGNSSDVRMRVRRNEVDFGFASKHEPDDAELAFTPLFRDRLGLLATTDCPLFAESRITWGDLAGYDFVGVTEDTASGAILDQLAGLPASVKRPRYEVSDNSSLLAIVKQGIGITTVAALAAADCERENLTFRRLSHPARWRTVYLVSRRGRTLPATAHELIETVRAGLRTVSRNNDLIELLGS